MRSGSWMLTSLFTVTLLNFTAGLMLVGNCVSLQTRKLNQFVNGQIHLFQVFGRIRKDVLTKHFRMGTPTNEHNDRLLAGFFPEPPET
jgi:hypothetical protein